MIFVTVGTHEQQFNRLLKCIDELKGEGKITDDVMMQTGYSDYTPKYCKWKKLLSYSEMIKMVEEARIVITHGGPSSFIMPLQIGKIPIVVPRKKCFNEHVNDHQVEFCNSVEKRMGIIIVVEDVSELTEIISDYDNITKKMNSKINSNNEKFCNRLETIINELI